jgi:hypothetical protein
MPPSDNQWMAFIALPPEEGNPTQVKKIKCVGIERFIGQGDAEDIEVFKGVFGF